MNAFQPDENSCMACCAQPRYWYSRWPHAAEGAAVRRPLLWRLRIHWAALFPASARAGLVLRNNGGDDKAISSVDATYTFSTSVVAGTSYNVTVLSNPSSPT